MTSNEEAAETNAEEELSVHEMTTSYEVSNGMTEATKRSQGGPVRSSVEQVPRRYAILRYRTSDLIFRPRSHW